MELQPDAPPAPVAPGSRDWSELPLDALTSVFDRLRDVDVLMGAGLVCHSWLEAAKAPELWRKVELRSEDLDFDDTSNDTYWDTTYAMAKMAVDRSNGKLEVFVGEDFVTDRVLEYIGDRSPCLKRLELVLSIEFTGVGLTCLVNKCPLLEDIEVSDCFLFSGHAIVDVGRACPRLRRLTLVHTEVRNEQLMAVVDSCPCLEYLHLENCIGIVANDALRAKCAAIKTVSVVEITATEEDVSVVEITSNAQTHGKYCMYPEYPPG